MGPECCIKSQNAKIEQEEKATGMPNNAESFSVTKSVNSPTEQRTLEINYETLFLEQAKAFKSTNGEVNVKLKKIIIDSMC